MSLNFLLLEGVCLNSVPSGALGVIVIKVGKRGRLKILASGSRTFESQEQKDFLSICFSYKRKRSSLHKKKANSLHITPLI